MIKVDTLGHFHDVGPGDKTFRVSIRIKSWNRSAVVLIEHGVIRVECIFLRVVERY